MARHSGGLGGWLEQLSGGVTHWTASSWGFGAAVAVVLLWAMTGPLFGFSNTWQLVINTGTTIVTFLMVFLIQRSQNKDARALHLKLNEVVAALEGASNRLIHAEEFSEHELAVLNAYYSTLASMAKSDRRLTQSHSIEEARRRHGRKAQVSST